MFGKGAFVDVNKKDINDNLPAINAVNPNPKFDWKPEDDKKLVYSPNQEKEKDSVYDLTFEE